MPEIDPYLLDDVADAIHRYETATRSYERRAAYDEYRALTADPHLVENLIADYEADAPDAARYRDLAGTLRTLAGTVDRWGAGTSTTPPETAGIVAVITATGNLQRRTGMPFLLSVDQEVDLTATYQDAHGNPADVESQTWESSDDNVLTVTDNGDGTATATSETTGTAQITLRADARFGPDTREIIGTLDVEVVAAEAMTATITPGEPRDTGTPAGNG